MRAKLFDWVLHCTKVTQIEDKNVFFTACQYVDGFYAKVGRDMPKKDLQLTAIACIFIASKLLDTVCLKLSFCRDVLGHKKFSSAQILEKEAEVIQLCRWELTRHTQYDVFQLLILMLNARVQDDSMPKEIVKFVSEFETLALNLVRADQISSNLTPQFDYVLRCAGLIQVALGYSVVQNQDTFKSASPNHCSYDLFKAYVGKIVAEWRVVCETKLGRSLLFVRQVGLRLALQIAEAQESYVNELQDFVIFGEPFKEFAQRLVQADLAAKQSIKQEILNKQAAHSQPHTKRSSTSLRLRSVASYASPTANHASRLLPSSKPAAKGGKYLTIHGKL
jgi:hypothetical protein